ncbi:MAG: sensor histidine kinase [Lachnospiraceae bacterium]
MTGFKILYRQGTDYVNKIVKYQGLSKNEDNLPLINEQRDLITDICQLQEFYFEIVQNENTIYTSLPQEVQLASNNKVVVKSIGNQTFIMYRENNTAVNIEVTYIKVITEIYHEHHARILQSAVFAILCSLIISLLLYYQMKKIYRPIQNISHELRTPLTLISGYSELLTRTKTTEQEKIDMGLEIFNQATHLQEIIQHLLLMGDLKDGEVEMDKIMLSDIVKQMERTYPLIISTSDEEPIIGNHLLLTRLLINLLDNAARESNEIQLSISGKTMAISNAGKTIPKNVLRKLNKGKKLNKGEYQGAGQGFLIIREIITLHQGKINIISNANETIVNIEFP